MIKAIETIYNGYRFRSRLEARWAVFFDTLGIDYQYEPEGYNLGRHGYYLPDFWLVTDFPDDGDGMFVEVKPVQATSDELRKLYILTLNTKTNACIIQGQPYPAEYKITFMEIWDGDHGPLKLFKKPRITTDLQIVEEIVDSTVTGGHPEYYHEIYLTNGKQVIHSCTFLPYNICLSHGYDYENNAKRKIVPAFLAARQARFEHGENGRR